MKLLDKLIFSSQNSLKIYCRWCEKSSQGYIIASSIFNKYASNECLLISWKYSKKVYSSTRYRWTSFRPIFEWNVHHYRKQWRYLGLFNDREASPWRGSFHNNRRDRWSSARIMSSTLRILIRRRLGSLDDRANDPSALQIDQA